MIKIRKIMVLLLVVVISLILVSPVSAVKISSNTNVWDIATGEYSNNNPSFSDVFKPKEEFLIYAYKGSNIPEARDYSHLKITKKLRTGEEVEIFSGSREIIENERENGQIISKWSLKEPGVYYITITVDPHKVTAGVYVIDENYGESKKDFDSLVFKNSDEFNEFIDKNYFFTVSSVENAIDNNQTDKVRKIMNDGFDVNRGSYLKPSLLLYAAENANDPEIIQILIDSGADISDTHNTKNAMTYAATNENPGIIRSLIKAGISNSPRFDPLIAAAQKNDNPEIYELILKNGGNVNAEYERGKTPLMIALENNRQPEIIKLLIDAGADVNKKDTFYDQRASVIHYASKYNEQPKTIDYLIRAGAKINVRDENGETPLVYAIKNNNDINVIKTLINNGSRVKTRDSKGNSTLMLAVKESENLKLINLLLNSGSDIKAKNSAESSALTLASIYNENPEIIRRLIEAGDKVNRSNENGFTPLFFAAGAGESTNENPEVYKVLIEKGANVNAKNKYNINPLHYAVRNTENSKIIQILLDAGANVNIKDDSGDTVLHMAAKYNANADIIKKLIDAGANVNATNSYNQTPLILAARYTETPEIISLLLDVGADPTIEDKLNYDTALEYAENNTDLSDTEAYWKLNDASF
jgi:ankyrin repeat protein